MVVISKFFGAKKGAFFSKRDLHNNKLAPGTLRILKPGRSETEK